MPPGISAGELRETGAGLKEREGGRVGENEMAGGNECNNILN